MAKCKWIFDEDKDVFVTPHGSEFSLPEMPNDCWFRFCPNCGNEIEVDP